MKSIGEKGFILGGLVILLAVYGMQESKTIIPQSVKIAGGVLLIAYGLFRILKRQR